jgi:hypothetical protein
MLTTIMSGCNLQSVGERGFLHYYSEIRGNSLLEVGMSRLDNI